MNGYTVKYLFYKNTGKSTITIPRAIIEVNNLNWGHKEDIGVIIKTIDGKQGLFLWKREKKNNENKEGKS